MALYTSIESVERVIVCRKFSPNLICSHILEIVHASNTYTSMHVSRLMKQNNDIAPPLHSVTK